MWWVCEGMELLQSRSMVGGGGEGGTWNGMGLLWSEGGRGAATRRRTWKHTTAEFHLFFSEASRLRSSLPHHKIDF